VGCHRHHVNLRDISSPYNTSTNESAGRVPLLRRSFVIANNLTAPACHIPEPRLLKLGAGLKNWMAGWTCIHTHIDHQVAKNQKPNEL
jgi:hypothetical protein